MKLKDVRSNRGSIAIEGLLSISILMILVISVFGTLLTITCDEKLEWAVLQTQGEMGLYSMPFMGDEHIVGATINETALTLLAKQTLNKHLEQGESTLLDIKSSSKVRFTEYGVAEFEVHYGYRMPNAVGEKILFIPIGASLISDGNDFSDHLVFITNYGEKYHIETCHHLRKSKYGISLDKAIEEGYEACKNCHKENQ